MKNSHLRWRWVIVADYSPAPKTFSPQADSLFLLRDSPAKGTRARAQKSPAAWKRGACDELLSTLAVNLRLGQDTSHCVFPGS